MSLKAKKRISVFLMALTMMATPVFATIHLITTSGFSFAPSNITNVELGDTIRWSSSGNHTVTSTSVPMGAATWSSPSFTTASTFDYVPTVAGNYSYKCGFHATMTGSFTVSIPTSLEKMSNSTIKVYPSNFSSELFIEQSSLEYNSVMVFDMLGKKVSEQRIVNERHNIASSASLAALQPGVYFVCVSSGNEVKKTFKVIKS